MVDLASRATMPSESEVNVARSFLTKILRSSMRRNRFKGKHASGSRPHSWHTSKLNEEETSGKQASAAAVWQPKHDTRPKDLSLSLDESQLSSALSSVKPMERMERTSHPFPSEHIPPTKYSPSSDSFTSSDPPFRKGTSAENIFFKGLYPERGRFFINGGWEGTQDQPMSRLSVGGRPNVGPVWQIPEKKKSQSSPPPPLPLRSDSFAVTKVFPFSEAPQKGPNRSAEHLLDNNLRNQQDKIDLRRSLNPLPTNTNLLHHSSIADHSYKHPNKLFSLSSNDVRHFGPQPIHKRQFSDESPLYLNTRAAPNAKSQSVGSYYRSLQDLPTNIRKNHRSATLNLSANPNVDMDRVGKYYRPTQEHKWLSSNDAVLKLGLKAKALYNLERNGQAQQEATRKQEESALKKQLDPWVPQEDHRITAQKTPLLHSLAQENRGENSESAGSGKIGRRSDRYATTLRNEIQQKRAQLQKSRSAATLTCMDKEDQAEDQAEDWRSTEMSNTYKDHLKEAQARVLQATSFQRRDLEPGLSVKSSARVRGRKRLNLAKRTHSFSEPDKIDKLGVDVDHQSGNFTDAKPIFCKPVTKPSHSAESKEQEKDKHKEKPGLSAELKPTSSEQLRLGTFAEYQARWSKQRKEKSQGRCHSAENILDAETEEALECVHERSRSSPSADFYATNNPPLWRELPVPKSCSAREETETAVQAPDHSPQPPQPLPRSERPLPDAQRSPTPGEAAERPKPEQTGSHSCSPSPQFCPLTITDRPPAVDVDCSPRSVDSAAALDLSPVKKVPVLILQSETGSEHHLSPQSSAPSLGSISCSGPSASSAFRPVTALDTTQPTQKSPLNTPELSHKSPLNTPPPSQESPQVAPPCPPPCPQPDPHTAEDMKREELARDIMDKDRSLAEVLDQSGRRTTMDLMEGLYPEEEGGVLGVKGQKRRASSTSSRAQVLPRSTDRPEEDSLSAAACLVPSSSYYSTSAPKAELLIKMKDMDQDLDSEDELDTDLASKKQELIWSLAKKLEVLREARQSLQDDVEQNEALGREVEATVQRRCQPNQLDRFRMFVGDLDKVVSLLLSLSGRLARVENALYSLEEEAPNTEKHTLTEKRKLLMRQHEDAKELKENLDRREKLVSVVMETHLDPESLDDYRHFVKMKSALIIEQRKLEDKIKLGEEQLKCLMDSLPLDQRPLL